MTGQPPWVHVRVVWACTGLTALEKLVYAELRGLSFRRTGCTMGAGALAARLGCSRETIERARRALVELGLLRKVDRGSGLSAGWLAELPEPCRPGHRRLADDDVQRLADRLTARFARIAPNRAQSGGISAATSPSEPAHPLGTAAATLASPVTPPPRSNAWRDRQLRALQPVTSGESGDSGPTLNYEQSMERGGNEVPERRAVIFE